MIKIVVNKTYRGKYGLLIQGHAFNLDETRIERIEHELENRKPSEKFDYRVLETSSKNETIEDEVIEGETVEGE